MLNEKKNKASRLFDRYAANLSYYHPSLANSFLCPLCLQFFSKNAIETDELSLEHIIPSAIGGRFETLTCRNCNCGDGSRLDAHFIKRLRIEDKFTGNSSKPLDTRIQVGKGEAGAHVYFGEQIRIIVIPQISHPKSPKVIIDELESGVTSFSISGILGYKKLSSAVGLLRIAYLLAFSYFGYGYVLHENLEQVRWQIAHPETATDVLGGFFTFKDVVATNVMGLLNEPAELRCFVAVIETMTEVRRLFGVVLPGLDLESKNIYRRWSIVLSDVVQRLRSLDLISFDPSYVLNPEFKHLPARIWAGQVQIGGRL